MKIKIVLILLVACNLIFLFAFIIEKLENQEKVFYKVYDFTYEQIGSLEINSNDPYGIYINSFDELELYFNNLEKQNKLEYDVISNAENLILKYNEEYFLNNDLVIVFINGRSPSIEYEVQTVAKELDTNTLSIFIKSAGEEVITADASYLSFTIELQKINRIDSVELFLK